MGWDGQQIQTQDGYSMSVHFGRVRERLNRHDWKSCRVARSSRVQIPPLPPFLKVSNRGGRLIGAKPMGFFVGPEGESEAGRCAPMGPENEAMTDGAAPPSALRMGRRPPAFVIRSSSEKCLNPGLSEEEDSVVGGSKYCP